jgi:hypothetical protein
LIEVPTWLPLTEAQTIISDLVSYPFLIPASTSDEETEDIYVRLLKKLVQNRDSAFSAVFDVAATILKQVVEKTEREVTDETMVRRCLSILQLADKRSPVLHQLRDWMYILERYMT